MNKTFSQVAPINRSPSDEEKARKIAELIGPTKRSHSDKSGEWHWRFRILILISFALLALKISGILEYWRSDKPEAAQIYLPIAVFVFIHGIGVWLIRTHDAKKQFADTFDQKQTALFSHALQLLFKKDNIIANSAGLKELVALKTRDKTRENRERVDTITSSGLELEGAKLQGADLQGAKLQNIAWNEQTRFAGVIIDNPALETIIEPELRNKIERERKKD